ncbi:MULTISPECIES: hypothetical protein [unclassified Chryseobacterium]|uniref:hypothetical protein n=1 Tax=unclassified Chryseobacterium TaxID=2593645 RepID=UPI000D38905F|nr:MULTISPECIES: hypothetical protein [unclassified Chryseobacterium]PTT74436.1 hypothetical protein DBR25_10860 [Chryseobacterium sp. HMWF001]PVV50797.1 hypothetical protein DD829_21580 [Chryseobacterium sp. HMWF035]
MKKSYFLMLMALVLFMISCRTEDTSSDSFSSETQKEKAKVYLMKDVPAFKNFLETKINSSNYFSKSNSYAALLFDNQPVDVVKKGNKTSYSTFTKKDDTVYEILVYTIGEKESFFIAQYISNTPIPYLDLTTFSGTVHYKSYNGELISSLSFENGIAKTAAKNADKTAIGCYTVITTPVSCIEGLHFPGKPCAYAGTINAAYYDTQIINSCFQDEFYNEIGNGGSYGPDGGAGSNPAYSLPASSAINYMLTQIGMQSLNTQQFSYLQNHLMEADNLRAYFLANQNVDTANFMYFGINFLMQNPTTTWEQFQNWFMYDIHITTDMDARVKCILQKMTGDTNISDDKITLPITPTSDNLFQKMLRMFNGNNAPKLTFKYDHNLPATGAYASTKSYDGGVSYEIVLGTDMLQSSNIRIMTILAHELTHAFMLNDLTQLNMIEWHNDGTAHISVGNAQNACNQNDFFSNNPDHYFANLLCLYMTNSPSSLNQWQHEIFETPTFDINSYIQKLTNYVKNNHDWNSESASWTSAMQTYYGNNWKYEVALNLQMDGIRQTSHFASWSNKTPTQFHNEIVSIIDNGHLPNTNNNYPANKNCN